MSDTLISASMEAVVNSDASMDRPIVDIDPLRRAYDWWEAGMGRAGYSRDIALDIVPRDDGKFDLIASGRDKAVVGVTTGETPKLLHNDEFGVARQHVMATFADMDTGERVARAVAAYYARPARYSFLDGKVERDARGEPVPSGGVQSDFDYLASLESSDPIAFDTLAKRFWPVFGFSRRVGRSEYVADVVEKTPRARTSASAASRAAASSILSDLSKLPPDVLKSLDPAALAALTKFAAK